MSSTYFPAPEQRSGVYRSLDNGETWTRLDGLLPHSFLWSLAIFADQPNRLLMGTEGDGVIAARLE